MQAGLLEHVRTFVRVAETGSFTAVAAEQGQSQPTVSRQISALEERLGVRLLQRSTRALAITEAGRTYLALAKELLESAEAAEAAMRLDRTMVSGTLRIAAPIAFARLHLMPLMAGFLEAYPQLRTEWRLGDRSVDLVEEGIDVAIRIGQITEQGLVARRIGETRRITVATPAYWRRYGRPKVPSNLTGHDCIVYTGLATVDEWHFSGADGVKEVVRISGRIRIDASEGMRAAVLEGLGVAVVPTWLFRGELEDGTLAQVLEAWEPAPLPIQAVTPTRRLMPARVRAFVDHVAHAFRADPRLTGRGVASAGVAEPAATVTGPID